MKIGIIKEGKVPMDERVPLTPNQIVRILNDYPDLTIKVQRSDVRRIKDSEYASAGIEVVDSVADCDILLGVKEVPKSDLIPGKTYFFFSHTIKKQPYNKTLLQEVLCKQIRLIDWECLREPSGERLIGFGRYAGIVGAYNGFRALGKLERSFELKKAIECADRSELSEQLQKILLGNQKILLTGRGKVAKGALEILHELKIREVDVDAFLNQQFSEPVYCQITFLDYFKRKDGEVFNASDFFTNPKEFESDFMRFARVADIFIAGHFWGAKSPFLFTRDDAKKTEFNISLVADISCDIDGPVASTLRPSTIEDPFYGYDAPTESEVEFGASGSIAVMAVDNLPCELPRDASHDFGEMFMERVFPEIMNGDVNQILEKATIADKGEVTSYYNYLNEWVNS